MRKLGLQYSAMKDLLNDSNAKHTQGHSDCRHCELKGLDWDLSTAIYLAQEIGRPPEVIAEWNRRLAAVPAWQKLPHTLTPAEQESENQIDAEVAQYRSTQAELNARRSKRTSVAETAKGRDAEERRRRRMEEHAERQRAMNRYILTGEGSGH
jgi:hypothetical protein